MISNEDEQVLLQALQNQHWSYHRDDTKYLDITKYRGGILSAWWDEAKIKASSGDQDMKLLIAEFIKLRLTS